MTFYFWRFNRGAAMSALRDGTKSTWVTNAQRAQFSELEI
jgi:hypothetical protein